MQGHGQAEQLMLYTHANKKQQLYCHFRLGVCESSNCMPRNDSEQRGNVKSYDHRDHNNINDNNIKLKEHLTVEDNTVYPVHTMDSDVIHS